MKNHMIMTPAVRKI